MSCKYEEIKCPKCGSRKHIEKRQEIVFCSNKSCGIYFDRFGNIREYNEILVSTTPLYTGLKNLIN